MALAVPHKGIEVKGVTFPLLKDGSADETDGATYGGNGKTIVQVGTEDEKIELVATVFRRAVTLERYADDTLRIDLGRGDAETGHGALADQYAGIVDAVGTKAVLVEPLENTVGVEFLTHSQIVKPYLVTLLHG